MASSSHDVMSKNGANLKKKQEQKTMLKFKTLNKRTLNLMQSDFFISPLNINKESTTDKDSKQPLKRQHVQV